MRYKEFPLWLKYGILIGFGIPVLEFLILHIGILSWSDTRYGLINSIIENIDWITFLLLFTPFHIFYAISPFGCFGISELCGYAIAIVVYFIIGSIVGLIIGKIKSKNSK